MSRLALLDRSVSGLLKTSTATSGAAFFPSIATASFTSCVSTLLQPASQLHRPFLGTFCAAGLRGFVAMAFGLGRGLSTPLLVINFVLYLISACLAGWALNRDLDAIYNQGDGYVGNNVTYTFLLLTLVASMVGLASIFAGIHHVRLWRGDSLAAAAATSLTAWLLTLLAMGVACKEIHVGGGNRLKRLKALEAFMIILSLFELLYLLSLHAGFLSGSDDAGYNHNRTGPKTTYGTPAATAV